MKQHQRQTFSEVFRGRTWALLLALVLLAPVGAKALERQIEPKDLHGWSNYGDWRLSRCTSFTMYNWYCQFDGTTDLKGLELDLQGDVGFPYKNRVAFNLTHDVSPQWNLHLDYHTFSNSGTIKKSVIFRDRTFQVGSFLRVKTSWIDLGFSRIVEVLKGDPEKKRSPGFVDVMGGFKLGAANVDVRGQDLTGKGIKESWRSDLPIPYLGFGLGTQISKYSWLKGILKHSALVESGDSLQMSELDLQGTLRMNPHSHLSEWFLTLGYRWFLIDSESGDDVIEANFTGPTLGVVGRFF